MCKNAITCSDVLAVLADEARSKDLLAKTVTAKTGTAKTGTAKTTTGKTRTAKTTTVPATDDDEPKPHPTTSTMKRFIPVMEGSKRAHRPNCKYLNE